MSLGPLDPDPGLYVFGPPGSGSVCLWAPWIRMSLGPLDPDPDPVLRSMDPDPDPSIIEQK
jgi:hypothetical protein